MFFSRKRKAFTLLELLIVIAIIGILALLALPQFFGAAVKAKESQAKSALSEIRKVALAFESKYGTFPAVGAGGAITVDLDNDGNNDMTITLLNSQNYSCGINVAGLITCTPQGGGGHVAYTMDCTTGVMAP